MKPVSPNSQSNDELADECRIAARFMREHHPLHVTLIGTLDNAAVALSARSDSAAPHVDRGDAVNLAYHISDKDTAVTPIGIRLLADAVLRMDAALKKAAPQELRNATVSPVSDSPTPAESARNATLLSRTESAAEVAHPKLCEDCGCELDCVKYGCAKKFGADTKRQNTKDKT